MMFKENSLIMTSNKSTRQHIVRLREKSITQLWREPCLFAAAIFLSVILTSCGSHYMEGYMPHETNNRIETNEPQGSDSIASQNNSYKDTDEPATTQEPTSTGDIGSSPISTETSEPVSTPTPEVANTALPTETDVPTTPAQGDADESDDIVDPYVPYTYEHMIEDSLKLRDRYPEILSLDLIGYSVEGRDLTLIKLGKGEKKIILCASHHAREYITSSYLMKLTEQYAKIYSSQYDQNNYGDYNVKNLLDQITVYIVPMVNPDGVNLVINGIDSVSNQESVAAMAMIKKTYKEWKANINGVDLNRQYPAQWAKKYDEIGKPASESFKGESYATEPEVKAMMELSRDNDFILSASFHTKGNVIFWADSATVYLIPGAKEITNRLSKLTKYKMMPISEKPEVYGAGYENWFRLEFLRPSFCIELTPSNNTDIPHDNKKFDTLVWNKAKYIGLFLADEALKCD